MVKRLVQNLLHKDLSYQIHGSAIEVRKDFGPGHKEKLYQKALEEELKRRKIHFEKEKPIKIYSPKDGKYIGLYRPDFIIDEKIIVETKAEKFVNRDEIKRVYDYLRNSEYELAYLINFASPQLFVKRIIYTNERKLFLKNLLVSISLILVLFGGLQEARAVEISFDVETINIAVDQQFQVGVVLNTDGEEINAIEGKIIFSSELLELKEIRDGNSIVNFWIERPRQHQETRDKEQGEIIFSGITPGGFKGEKGLIFSAIFKAKKEGTEIIEIREIKALLNDGQGTAAELTIKNLEFKIQDLGEKPLYPESYILYPDDLESPESFVPEIASDPAVFEGKWFVVFATQDKSSGIDRYEVKERREFRIKNLEFRETSAIFYILNPKFLIFPDSWIIAESPYVLKDQKLRSYIYVKAVDRAGNERIEMLEPRYPLRWYENYFVWVIILLGIVIIYYLIRKSKIKVQISKWQVKIQKG